jgi:hypothetical protein
MRRDIFQAIADPTRRAIIALIALQAMTPTLSLTTLTPRGKLFQTPSHTHRMRTGKTGTTRQEIYYSLQIEK